MPYLFDEWGDPVMTTERWQQLFERAWRSVGPWYMPEDERYLNAIDRANMDYIQESEAHAA